MFGGVQAVTWTDVKQMVLIVFGLFAVFIGLLFGLPDGVGPIDALNIAGATGRLQTFDFSFDLTKQYTFWSGTIAALFLFLSYFGTDQSQVQRYLTAKSVDEARTSLLMSAYWKIPLQALVLLIGVLLFLFYLFTPPPLLFNPVHEQQVRRGGRAADYQVAESKFAAAHEARRQAATSLAEARRSDDSARAAVAATEFNRREAEIVGIRADAITIIRESTGDRAFSDVNYVFPTYVMTRLPMGVVGIVIAAIFAAAMSTISASSRRSRPRR